MRNPIDKLYGRRLKEPDNQGNGIAINPGKPKGLYIYFSAQDGQVLVSIKLGGPWGNYYRVYRGRKAEGKRTEGQEVRRLRVFRSSNTDRWEREQVGLKVI